MLSRIEIRHFAIIDQLAIDWKAGFSVITGETGAGKSIAIDALNLALGERADSSQVAAGKEQAEVIAIFDLASDSAAMQWLHEQSLDDENECILRRVIRRNGRGQCFINGRSVTQSSLRELGQLLVDVHGQHSQQSLLRKSDQLRLLDRFGQHQALLQRVAEAASQLRQLEQQRQALHQAETERLARLELLTYQVEELEQAGPNESLLAELETRHRQAATVAERTQISGEIQRILDSEYSDGLFSQLSHLLTLNQSLCQLDPSAIPLSDTLVQAQEILEEYKTQIRHYGDRLEHDPTMLAELDAQLALFHDLARKHQVRLEQLPEKLAELKAELTRLTDAQQALSDIDVQLERAREAYNQAAQQLSKQRQRTARALNKEITALIQQLAMDGGRFEVSITTGEKVAATGVDDVEFLVSANPGQPLQPLTRVASGGELSRISLAIAVVTAKQQLVPSLVFDEIDVGIGGSTAEVVGRLLRQLGTVRQVISVTHQPQVAACGHHHLRAEKSKTKRATSTTTRQLNDAERIEEIARMLGGIEISKATRQSASELLAAQS